MKKRSGLRAAILCGALLVSCAHDPAERAARDSAIAAVKTISVDPLVVMPNSVHYVSAGQVWGAALGGLVGAAIASASSPAESIRASLDKDQINVDAIVVEELRAAMGTQDRFRLVDHDADAVLRITVKEYGFHVAGAFTSRMKVLLKVVGKLEDKSDTELFKSGASTWNTEATQYTMDEFLADPAKMRAAFHEVGAIIARKQTAALLRRSGVTVEEPAEPMPPATETAASVPHLAEPTAAAQTPAPLP